MKLKDILLKHLHDTVIEGTLNTKRIDFFIDCFQVATARYGIVLEEDPRWTEINDLARSVVPDYKEII